MRKMKIGIFAVFTAILFILSTSISVTAATYEETLMILESNVHDSSPKATATMYPQDVWSYSDWEWTVDISNGDNVVIRTTCNYTNSIPYNPPPYDFQGRHYFKIEATYIHLSPPDSDYQEDEDEIETYGSIGGVPASGSFTQTVTFNSVNPGGTIYLHWYVEAENIPDSVEDDMDHTGTVYLT
jgi:hypothetical protein